MYKDVRVIIIFSILSSLAGVFVSFGRQRLFKKYSVETVYLVDLFLTGILVMVAIYLFGNTKNIIPNIQNFNTEDWAIMAGTSLFFAATLLYGGKILQHNNISYLTILDTGVDLLAGVLVAYMFFNEKIRKKKIFGMLLVAAGIIVLH